MITFEKSTRALSNRTRPDRIHRRPRIRPTRHPDGESSARVVENTRARLASYASRQNLDSRASRVRSPTGALARSSTDAGTLTPFPRTPIVASDGGLAEPPPPAAPPLDFPAVVTIVVTNVVRVTPGDHDDDPDASSLARRDSDEASSSTFIAAGVVGGRARRPPPPGSDAGRPREDVGPEHAREGSPAPFDSPPPRLPARESPRDPDRDPPRDPDRDPPLDPPLDPSLARAPRATARLCASHLHSNTLSNRGASKCRR